MAEKKTTKKTTPAKKATSAKAAASQKPASKKELKSPLDSKHAAAAVSYISVLFIIPLLTHKDDEFVQFHVKQGMVLFGIQFVAILLLFTIVLAPLTPILLLLAFVAAGYGFVSALADKKAKIPGAQWLITHLNI